MVIKRLSLSTIARRFFPHVYPALAYGFVQGFMLSPSKDGCTIIKSRSMCRQHFVPGILMFCLLALFLFDLLQFFQHGFDQPLRRARRHDPILGGLKDICDRFIFIAEADENEAVAYI